MIHDVVLDVDVTSSSATVDAIPASDTVDECKEVVERQRLLHFPPPARE